LHEGARDDLLKLAPSIMPVVLKKLLLLADAVDAGAPLRGELAGYRKLVAGRHHWRIVYRIAVDGQVEVCEVWCVGARADAEVYAEAVSRVEQAAQSEPCFIPLRDAVQQLGEAALSLLPLPLPIPEPVPDWLAQRLIHSAGLSADVVAGMGLQEAVAAWETWMTGGQQG
jgi:mRNA interferase RelE/StbE